MEKQYRKTMLTLPSEVVAAFAALGDDTEGRNRYVHALRGAQWTLSSIAAAAGITRERVRQIVDSPNPDPEALVAGPVPEPPVHETREPREFVEPDPEKLARLLALKPLAQQVRSNGDKYRAEAEEYSRLIAEVHLEDGVTLYRLAKRLGVTHGALRFRLARYGYKLPKTGDSKVYKPIKAENRV